MLEKFEAGVALTGTEVKSVRTGLANLKDAYGLVKDNEIFLLNAHIGPYEHGNIHNHAPLRTRKLLMHREEIRKLIGKTQQKGLTLIPTRLYFKNGKVKVELALAKGKQLWDKRETETAQDRRPGSPRRHQPWQKVIARWRGHSCARHRIRRVESRGAQKPAVMIGD